MASTRITDFLISDKTPIDYSSINDILHKFIENDQAIYGNFDKIPGLWKCKWYNDDRIPGYNKGDFFWLNTEMVRNYLRDNSNEIREYANANPMITEKLPTWKSNDDSVFSAYFNVLTGYIDKDKSCPMSALVEIGDISCCNQLIISTKDNNKDPISNLSSWKRFCIEDEDYDTIVENIYSTSTKTIKDHNFNYHFGNDILTPEIYRSLTNYANTDFSNVNIMYPKNYLKNGNHCSGFDSIEAYVKKPVLNGSNYTLEYQWFRKWRSGYLEHGGIVNSHRFLSDLSNTVLIPFNWKLTDDKAKVYDLRYIGSGDSVIEVDESKMFPPGDNLISVLYELNPESFTVLDSRTAPIYGNINYSINVTPFYVNEKTENILESIPSYENLGNYKAENNIVNTNIDQENITLSSFAFDYNAENSAEYYSYYTAGFCKL